MKKISGKYVYLKDVDPTEHKKIYYIRHNNKLNKFINEISKNKKDQKKFIKNQKNLGNIFFGIYRKRTNQFLGTISIYPKGANLEASAYLKIKDCRMGEVDFDWNIKRKFRVFIFIN